jgi:hypothetical protein
MTRSGLLLGAALVLTVTAAAVEKDMSSANFHDARVPGFPLTCSTARSPACASMLPRLCTVRVRRSAIAS